MTIFQTVRHNSIPPGNIIYFLFYCGLQSVSTLILIITIFSHYMSHVECELQLNCIHQFHSPNVPRNYYSNAFTSTDTSHYGTSISLDDRVN